MPRITQRRTTPQASNFRVDGHDNQVVRLGLRDLNMRSNGPHAAGNRPPFIVRLLHRATLIGTRLKALVLQWLDPTSTVAGP